MQSTFEGRPLAEPHDQFAIVVSRFNDLVTSRLLEGARNTLLRHGSTPEQITVVWAPGAFELPLICQQLASSGRFAAVVALGAVIQGQTTHHEYINHAVAQGIMQAGQKSGTPVLFGVLTCATMEQALDRAGGKAGNKGTEAMLAALETVDVLRQLSRQGIAPKP